MYLSRSNLGQGDGVIADPREVEQYAEAPLTRDWSPWIIGGAIVLSGVLALAASMKANRR